MFYFNAKLNAFKLPDLIEYVPSGGILAATAMPCGMLQRRSFVLFPHLRHRMFDPQLYLSGLDCRTAEKTIFKLATYSWFGVGLEEYDSSLHATHVQYKEQMRSRVLADWPREAPKSEKAIYKCVDDALSFQLAIGCETLIAPCPLTGENTRYTVEERYLDAACTFVRKHQISIPVLSTVAISDGLLRGTTPQSNVLLETISSHISARSELSGAYLVLEQANDTGYVVNNEDTLLSLLILVDDLARGAGKRVISNYLGHFGLVLTAAGGEVWSSGYYRSQRRMRLADQEEQEGRAYPRLFSTALLGDLGVDQDVLTLYREGLFKRVFDKTQASAPISKSLRTTDGLDAAPGWAYRPGNIAAAAAHYLDSASRLDAHSDGLSSQERTAVVERWLKHAADLADQIADVDLIKHTDVRHQKVWLSAFQKWKDYTSA